MPSSCGGTTKSVSKITFCGVPAVATACNDALELFAAARTEWCIPNTNTAISAAKPEAGIRKILCRFIFLPLLRIALADVPPERFACQAKPAKRFAGDQVYGPSCCGCGCYRPSQWFGDFSAAGITTVAYCFASGARGLFDSAMC